MLTPGDTERFRKRLEMEHASVHARVSALQQRLASPDAATETSGDAADDATLLFDHEQTLNEIARAQELLAQIEKALQRIADGTYGFSEVSGKPIPIERLEVLPYATTLVGEHLGE